MLKKYNVGIIGLGRVGSKWKDSHLNVYKNHPRVDRIFTCDIKKRANYKDYTEMIGKNDIDIVSVCTPPETHAGIVFDIAPYVKGIYCEKPIATTLNDADSMISVCHKYKTVLQINHQRLWNRPIFKFSRGILNSGTHVFSTIDYYFKDPKQIEAIYIDTNDPIFDLDFPHSPHVPKEAIDELIDCIENHKESRSSGEKAREALEKCLKISIR